MIKHPVPYYCLIFDADDTLRQCTVPGQHVPNTSDQWELKPNVQETLAQYDWASKHVFGLASNQGGIARRYVLFSDALRMLIETAQAALPIWPMPPEALQIRLCPHDPNDGCFCRKPQPGMLLSILEDLDINKDNALFIGDLETDREAASNAGIMFCYAKDFFGWE